MPLFHVMEDAATAAISRAQVWQWTRHSAHLHNGEAVAKARVRALIRCEIPALIFMMDERPVRAGFLSHLVEGVR